jgi:nitrogen fixation protein NifU and related proteins
VRLVAASPPAMEAGLTGRIWTVRMTYSAKLLDYFHHPRHAGALADASTVVEATNPVCGDVVKLWLRVEHQEITGATFKADGCVPAIACGSWLAERLSAGCTLEEARLIAPESISDGLDGLPAASGHAAELAVEVLRRALEALDRQAL